MLVSSFIFMSLKLWLVFEAVADEEENVKKALDNLIGNLKSEKGVEVIEEEYDEVQEIESPHPSMEEGYSRIAELRVECDRFTNAVKTVINYGPTYVQLEGPDHFDLDIKDSQESLQEVANTVQQYAQMGVGGVLVAKSDEE